MAIVNVNDNDFKQTVEQEGFVLVDFWAPWCGPCKMQSPVLDELDKDGDVKVTIAKLNVDDNPETTGAHNVMSIPTLKLFKDGKEVDAVTGFRSKQQLTDWLQQHA